MKKTVRPSLKAFLAEQLMTLKLISYERLIELAVEYGAKTSTAERRLRRGDSWDIPVKKLNNKKKLIKPGESISYYQWTGTRVVLRD